MNYVYKLTLQSAVPGCLRGQAWGILPFSRGPLPFLPIFSWPLSDLPPSPGSCASTTSALHHQNWCTKGRWLEAQCWPQDGGAPLESILHQPEAVGGFPEQRPLGTQVLALGL